MTTEEDVKKNKLTVYLIKEGYKEIEDFLSVGNFTQIKVNGENNDDGVLIYKGGFRTKPSWVSIFEDLPLFDPSTIWNQSSKAIFLLKHEERYFCFTFGYSKSLIDELAYERNFGLIVTLNLSDPDAIKSIDKTNIGHIALHSKEQATKDLDLGSFEFNDEIDLLKSVTGKSEKSEEGEREVFSGRDSVSIYTKVTLESFSEITKRLYNAFTDTKYKEIYPWIDKIAEVRDKLLLDELDAIITAKILNKDFELIWLAIPEVIIWEDIKGFAYKRKTISSTGSGPVLYQDLDINEWVLRTTIPDDLTAQKLKNKKIHIYWQDDRPPTNWSVYRCLNAEIEHENKTYILSDSVWYHIETQFVDETSNFYNSIPDSELNLPNYGTDTEPVYLQRVSDEQPEFALMDRKVIMIGGSRSRIEFCDLFSLNNDIIHVKKYGGSSLLSHLFFQALVSSEVFLFEEEFRIKVNEKLPDSHKLADPSLKPDSADYKICIAIMSEVPGTLELPFFSKVSLKHTVKTLRNLGYEVFKLKISRD